MNNVYTFIAIAVYLVYIVTVTVVYHVRRKRFTDTYRLMLSSRDYTSFVDAINAISKALDTEPEPEPAKHAPQEYVDLMVLTEERHAEQNLEDME